MTARAAHRASDPGCGEHEAPGGREWAPAGKASAPSAWGRGQRDRPRRGSCPEPRGVERQAPAPFHRPRPSGGHYALPYVATSGARGPTGEALNRVPHQRSHAAALPQRGSVRRQSVVARVGPEPGRTVACEKWRDLSLQRAGSRRGGGRVPGGSRGRPRRARPGPGVCRSGVRPPEWGESGLLSFGLPVCGVLCSGLNQRRQCHKRAKRELVARGAEPAVLGLLVCVSARWKTPAADEKRSRGATGRRAPRREGAGGEQGARGEEGLFPQGPAEHRPTQGAGRPTRAGA